nr:FAD-dependent oxidoreductase [Rhodoferax sp.]
MHIGIAGAGLLGRLLALELSRAGHRVDVFDPAGGPGPKAESDSAAAAWTAAGMLSPVAELECADARVFAWGLRSCYLWPSIVHGLGEPVGLSLHGSLLLAHRGDAGAAQRVVSLLQSKAGAPYQPKLLDAKRLAELEPSIQGPALSWLLPCEGQIHTVQAMQALAVQATRQGTHWHWRSTVHAVEPGLLRVQTQRSVRPESAEVIRLAQPELGDSLRFDHVFDVRGIGARPQLPVRGVRGEVFWLHAPGVQLSRAVRLMHPRHTVYIVPRPDDMLVVGASEIESEDRSPVSLRSTLELLSAAHSVIPELAEARVVHSETNLRPALPDNLPLLTREPGITRINGLYRHGWLVAPAMVEEALAGGLS